LSLPDPAHVVQFYSSDRYLLDGLGASLGSALQAGESVVAVTTNPHQKGLLMRLSKRGIDVAQATTQGRLILLDAVEALNKFMGPHGPNRQPFLREFGNLIRKAEAAAALQGKRVVIFGEMVAVLWRESQQQATIRLEQLWNELAETHFFHLRCAYPARSFHGRTKGEPYATICAEHSVVIPA
jgi:MEDS: MEthanogen/methylotroph, DcmR Sensory domain